MHTNAISRPGPLVSPRTTHSESQPNWGVIQGPGSQLSSEMQAIEPDKLMSRSGDCRTFGDVREWFRRSDVKLLRLVDKAMGVETYLRKHPDGHIEAVRYLRHYDGYISCRLTESNSRQILPQKGSQIFTQLSSCARTNAGEGFDLSQELEAGANALGNPSHHAPQAPPALHDAPSLAQPIPPHVQRQLLSLNPQHTVTPNLLDNSVSTIPEQPPVDDSILTIFGQPPDLNDSTSTVFKPMGSPYTAGKAVDAAKGSRPQGFQMARRTFKVPSYHAELVRSPAQGTPPQASFKLHSPRSPLAPNSPLLTRMAPQPGTKTLVTQQAGPFLKAWIRPMHKRVAAPLMAQVPYGAVQAANAVGTGKLPRLRASG